MSERPSLSKAALAEAYDVSLTTVDSWVRKGCPVEYHGGKGRPWQFDLTKVLRWREQRIRESSQTWKDAHGDFEEDGEKLDVQRSRARLAMYQAEEAEIDLKLKLGQLISVDEVLEIRMRELVGFRNGLLRLEDRLPSLLEFVSDRRAMAEIIRNEVHDILEKFAAADIDDIANMDFAPVDRARPRRGRKKAKPRGKGGVKTAAKDHHNGVGRET